MFYSGGTPELFACNKINRKEKDRRILNTKITAQLKGITGSRLDIGTCYSVFTNELMYVHVGFSTSISITNGTIICQLPLNVEKIMNVGIMGVNQNIIQIAAINAYNNNIYAAGTIKPGVYLINMVFKVA